VFHPGWDEFCELFAFSPGHDYVTGLDPVFMAAQSPEKYELYRSIGRGERTDAWKGRPVEAVIREEFGMEYAVVRPATNPEFAAELQRAELARPARATQVGKARVEWQAEGGGEPGWRIYRLLPPRKAK
jgi:hypothetical protein